MGTVTGAELAITFIVAIEVGGCPPQKSMPIFRFVVGPGTLLGGTPIIVIVRLAIVWVGAAPVTPHGALQILLPLSASSAASSPCNTQINSV